MTTPRPRFDPGELSGADPDTGDADRSEATLAARALEASIPTSDPVISADLADRIMVAVRREPAPRRIGILATLRRRPSPAGLVESLQLAWARVVTAGSVAVRATALAYVALVLVLGVSLSGVAAYSAAGALGLFAVPSRGPDATQLVSSPQPLQSPPSEVESPEPSDSAEPAETSEPTEAASDDSSSDTRSGGSICGAAGSGGHEGCATAGAATAMGSSKRPISAT